MYHLFRKPLFVSSPRVWRTNPFSPGDSQELFDFYQILYRNRLELYIPFPLNQPSVGPFFDTGKSVTVPGWTPSKTVFNCNLNSRYWDKKTTNTFGRCSVCLWRLKEGPFKRNNDNTKNRTPRDDCRQGEVFSLFSSFFTPLSVCGLTRQ